MDINYEKSPFTSRIIYGETFASTLPSLAFEKRHLIIITNQRYYDLFSEKINQLLGKSPNIDWYICPNYTNVNTLEELNSLIDYLSSFPQEDYVFIAFGNEGVVSLTSFIQCHAVFTSEFWVLPVSIRSFAQSLTKTTAILSAHQQPVLQTQNMPKLIMYDQTLTHEQTNGKMIDLLIFVVCGILCDRQFLKDLYFNYPDRKNLMSKPFTGMIDAMLKFYQEQGETIESYGTVFERAFYSVASGQVLSSSMKRFLGILFQLLWNVQEGGLSFNYRNLLLWFKQLGYPLGLPSNFMISDYVESVMKVLKKNGELPLLSKVGVINGKRMPTSKELIAVLEKYQTMMQEIG